LIKAASFTIAEATINASLALDPAASDILKPLNQRVLHIALESPQENIFILFAAGQVILLGQYEGDADLCLSGSLSQFVTLAQNSNEPNALSTSGVRASGKILMLGELQSAIAKLDLDIAQIIAKFAGDNIAEIASLKANSLKQRATRFFSHLQRSTTEYLNHESALQPSPYEQQLFSQQVQQFKQDVERLEAKLNLLEQKQ